MLRIREIALPAHAPVSGRIRLMDSVTFIAGPNGSGKSRLVRWLNEHLYDVAGLPIGSVIEAHSDAIRVPESRRYVERVTGGGVSSWMVIEGMIVQMQPSPGNSARLQLPNPKDYSGKLNRAVMKAAFPDFAEYLDEMADYGEAVNSSVLKEISTGIELPPSAFRPLRCKVLSARRMIGLTGNFPRPGKPTSFINEQLRETSVSEVFALLEADRNLEIEILNRVEALTGVRVQIAKEGGSYQPVFSRVGTPGTWGFEDEADGVNALLLLLPYLYSTEYDLVVIDEPEAHLFPGLQQTLRTLAFEACQITNKQVLLTTHSERMIAPPLPDFRSAVHVTIADPVHPQLENLYAVISGTGPEAHQLNDWLLKQAFGENQQSVFSSLFASEVVVVEGPFDLIFLDRLTRYVGRNFRAGSVALLDAGGMAGVSALVRFLKAMRRLVKVIVDADVVLEREVLAKISAAMGDDTGRVMAALDTGDVVSTAREFDIHILSKPGIEGFYHTSRGTPSQKPKQKRADLIRELKYIQSRSIEDVRSSYAELVEVLEVAVRRMPDEWIEAYSEELRGTVAAIIHDWRAIVRSGGCTPDELMDRLKPRLRSFASSSFDPSTGQLVLQHRFLSGIDLHISSADDPIDVLDTWLLNFRG
jgi:energy-coupling factor transporter ATP-binding protein EcfA2